MEGGLGLCTRANLSKLSYDGDSNLYLDSLTLDIDLHWAHCLSAYDGAKIHINRASIIIRQMSELSYADYDCLVFSDGWGFVYPEGIHYEEGKGYVDKDGNSPVSAFYGGKHLPNPITAIIRSLDDPFQQHDIWIETQRLNELNRSDIKSNVEAIFDSGTNDTLTIGGNVTVEAEGSIYGYSRRVPGRERVYYNSLLIKDKATVKAKSSDCGIYSWKELLLKDRHEIIAPEGAYWDAENHYVSYADGTTVGDEWITIAVEELTYDLNNDGKISTADIQIIINEMKKAQASQNMAYDLNGDGKISTADIQVIINEMKK